MERTPNRRAFLKLVGVTPLAGLPLLQQDKPTVDDPQRECLEWLIQGLKDKGMELTPAIAAGCLWGAEMFQQSLQRKEQEAQKQQQWRDRRDMLSGQARVDFVVERLKGEMGNYVPSGQKKALRCVVNNKPLASGDGEYLVGKVTQCFEGTTKSFQRKVLRCYNKVVLPSFEAEHREELALEKATDEYLRLIHKSEPERYFKFGSKTPQQIRTLTAKVKELV